MLLFYIYKWVENGVKLWIKIIFNWCIEYIFLAKLRLAPGYFSEEGFWLSEFI